MRGICRQTEAHNYHPFLIQNSVLLTILVLIFGRVDVFVWLLGFFSLGLESTLPFPQFMRLTFLFNHRALLILISSNYKQKSLYGFRMSTLAGWVGGDSFKYSHISIQARLQTRKFMNSSQDGLLFRSREPPSVQNLCDFPTLSGLWYVYGDHCSRILTSRLAAIIGQRIMYGDAPPSTALAEDEDLEQALALAEE